MSNPQVRVRFAPSPTGPLHLGGVRTALYNYLFAKKMGGKCILRIEDTDQTRFVPGAEQYIVDAFKWCGIEYDEGVHVGGEYGPYKQSERKAMYRQYADQLLDAGHAYYAFDTSEDLDAVREQAKKAKMPNWQYNATSRSGMKNSLTLSEDEVKTRLQNNEPYVIRIKIPRNEEVRFNDLIRGWIVVNTSNMDDKVLFKSDGMPTYHLANIVDDHLMKITHVIRGEEWLPSAPLHVLMYRYFGWESTMPEFAHLPLILKPDGNGKLSKRDGDRLGFPVFPLDWKDPISGEQSSGYKERGYFPAAFTNFLAMLGWNPGTQQELFTLEELCKEFSIEKVGKSGSKFDAEKAKWYNQQYLREKTNTELAELVKPLAIEKGYNVSDTYLANVCGMMKERASFVPELLDATYFFTAPTEYDEKTVKSKWKAETPERMQMLADVLENIADFTAQNIEAGFKAFLEEKELGFGAVLPNFRVLVTGEGMGPSMFEITALLGKQETLARIKTGLAKLS